LKVLFIGIPPEVVTDVDHDAVEEIIITAADALPLMVSCDKPVTLYALPDTLTDDHDTDSVSRLEIDADPEMLGVGQVGDGDLCFMLWDDSDRHHEMLTRLQDAGVATYDMGDNNRELVMGSVPEMDDLVNQITRRVTAAVLRIVREDMQDTPRQRRYRTSPSKG
jgi:hypothetical protein